jgi:hypothetical protein
MGASKDDAAGSCVERVVERVVERMYETLAGDFLARLFEKVETRLEHMFGTDVRASYAAAMETVQHQGLTGVARQGTW